MRVGAEAEREPETRAATGEGPRAQSAEASYHPRGDRCGLPPACDTRQKAPDTHPPHAQPIVDAYEDGEEHSGCALTGATAGGRNRSPHSSDSEVRCTSVSEQKSHIFFPRSGAAAPRVMAAPA